MAKGDTRMKCDRCNGQGFSVIAKWKCPVCDGKGVVEQTNEEWFANLSTEEKAKIIINIAVNSNCDYRTIVEWLKQSHREERKK